MTDKIVISIMKDNQEISRIETDGYLILYIDNDKIKSVGDIELKALAPIVMKIAVEKLIHAS